MLGSDIFYHNNGDDVPTPKKMEVRFTDTGRT